MNNIMKVLHGFHGCEKGGAGQGTLLMLIGTAVVGAVFSFAALNIGQNSGGIGKNLANSALLQQKDASMANSAYVSDNISDQVTKVIDNFQSTVQSSGAMGAQYDDGSLQPPTKSKSP
jgi:archaellin